MCGNVRPYVLDTLRIACPVDLSYRFYGTSEIQIHGLYRTCAVLCKIGFPAKVQISL